MHRLALMLFHYMEHIFILPLFFSCITICSVFLGTYVALAFDSSNLRKFIVYNTVKEHMSLHCFFCSEQERSCQARLLATFAYHNLFFSGLGESKLDCLWMKLNQEHRCSGC